MAVSYKELEGSGKVSFRAEGGVSAERIFEVDWADRLDFADELRGVVGRVIRTRPATFPGLAWLSCVDVTVEGSSRVLGTSDVIAYDKAKVTARYEPSEFDENDDRLLVTESLEPSVEFLTVPTEALFWDNAQEEPIAPEEAPGKLMLSVDWIYTIHEILALPAATLTLLGHVNQAAMRSPTIGLTFAAETLLFGIRPLVREITTEGVGAWTVTYVFSFNPTGWNRYYRPDKEDADGTPVLQYMYDSGGTIWRQYPTGNFNLIVL